VCGKPCIPGYAHRVSAVPIFYAAGLSSGTDPRWLPIVEREDLQAALRLRGREVALPLDQ